jgi:transcriptional regulator with XRE-family HTH domain
MQNRPYTPEQTFTQARGTMPRAKAQVSPFGARLTQLRKAAGYTQVELAEALGTTQRMIAYYEGPAENPPAALLPELAQLLGVSVDELLGVRPVRRTKKTDTRLQRRLQQVEKLDVKERRQVLQLLDAFIERAQLKRSN